ncbi:hypothetical protein SUGI_0441670 [Cryptomeria japonica]|uniref:xyloglucan endotransglucosylase protein 1 n=1 Tax=Cryptomeria japonica TaxID=3369 RepID=UPI002408C8E0|nr:xyloglucan endotransglucosylase protein 1 [Cryptomeria japonica]GLJ23340.1 hypothetical protein SUGI_0441670 [Cryptomeria japonica]
MAILLYILNICFAFTLASASISTNVDILYGADHIKVLDHGREMQLSLDQSSGSGIQSKNEYLFGKFDMKIKLNPKDSAGTVTSYYLSSQGSNHDELDFEFLGNLSGSPYIMQTNVFSNGGGNREVKFFLWFDPTEAFHTYTVLWNPHRIIFYVDSIPVSVFKNKEKVGVPYPNKQGMRMYSTIWNGSNWATRGGTVKIDWSKAPFIANYRSYWANACVFGKYCPPTSPWMGEGLNGNQKKLLKWVRKHYMIYDYCSDIKRFPRGFPRECLRN